MLNRQPPGPPQPPRPDPPPDPPPIAPIVYVSEPVIWEYHHIARDLSEQALPSPDDLNALGSQGWELAGMLIHAGQAHFYFKRQAG